MTRLLSSVCVAGLVAVGCTAPSETADATFPECRYHADMLQELKAKYRELPVAFGVLGSGVRIEIIAHPRGRTFTVILTDSTNRSCIIFAGEGWKQKIQFPFDPA